MKSMAALRARSSSFHEFLMLGQSRMSHRLHLPSNHRPNNSMCIRSITTSSRSNNPYLILGVPPSSSFRTVQKAFAKLAFEHHPDTSRDDDGAKVSADFIRVRQAFERIRDAKQQAGKSMGRMTEDDETNIVNPTKYSWTETDFLDYFHRQTGVRLTSEQRRELVHLYRTRVQGGSYGGHSWDLARRLVAEQDAYLRNMEAGGPPNGRRGARYSRPSSHQTGSPESEMSGASSNLRRKRKR